MLPGACCSSLTEEQLTAGRRREQGRGLRYQGTNDFVGSEPDGYTDRDGDHLAARAGAGSSRMSLRQ